MNRQVTLQKIVEKACEGGWDRGPLYLKWLEWYNGGPRAEQPIYENHVSSPYNLENSKQRVAGWVANPNEIIFVPK